VVKNNGHVHRRSHVDEILVQDNKASGIRLRNGTVFTARTGVVSNCDMKGTFNLVKPGLNEEFDKERLKLLNTTPLCSSFMHLHVGIDAKDLPLDMPPQWTVCNSWDKVS
jgi:phytoene dehydrogenase-like protein